MAFTGTYQCSRCKTQKQNREELVAKKVMFQQVGEQPRTLKSRTTEWLCANCVARDDDWNRPPYSSPGLINNG